MFQVGDVVKEYEGRLYRIIAFAEHTETYEPLVIYQPLRDRAVHACPYNIFYGKLPDGRQRFEVVEK